MLIWVSIGAAAASIAALSALSRWRSAQLDHGEISTRLRGVQDVLTDCYRKIQEIEEHIPIGQPATLYQKMEESQYMSGSKSNGLPA